MDQLKFTCYCRTSRREWAAYLIIHFFVLQNSAEDNREQHKDTLMTLSSKLLSIAKRHEAYQTMWSICCDLDDSELLQNLMV